MGFVRRFCYFWLGSFDRKQKFGRIIGCNFRIQGSYLLTSTTFASDHFVQKATWATYTRYDDGRKNCHNKDKDDSNEPVCNFAFTENSTNKSTEFAVNRFTFEDGTTSVCQGTARITYPKIQVFFSTNSWTNQGIEQYPGWHSYHRSISVSELETLIALTYLNFSGFLTFKMNSQTTKMILSYLLFLWLLAMAENYLEIQRLSYHEKQYQLVMLLVFNCINQ